MHDPAKVGEAYDWEETLDKVQYPQGPCLNLVLDCEPDSSSTVDYHAFDGKDLVQWHLVVRDIDVVRIERLLRVRMVFWDRRIKWRCIQFRVVHI